MARRAVLVVVTYVVVALLVTGWGWLLTHPWNGSIEGPDDDVSRWFADHRASWLNPLADAGTLLGETPVGLAVGAVVALVAGLALRSLAAVLLVAMADVGDGGIYWLGSHADPRQRPPVHILDTGLVPSHSFPSGHVGTAVAVYGSAAVLLAVWLRGRHRGAGAGRVAVVVLACVPVLVALSRLYQGAHHLTDVGTSIVYGTLWLVALAVALRPRDARAAGPAAGSSAGVREAPALRGAATG